MSNERKKAARKKLDVLRRQASEYENQLIDAFDNGKLSRRDFIRRGTVVGMSLPFLGVIIAACSPDEAATTTTAGAAGTTAAGPGTTSGAGPTTTEGSMAAALVRLGFAPPPAVGIEPVLINDETGLSIFGQTAQYLTFSDSELNLRPVLAESWSPNATNDEWTFNLRQGVVFNDGTPLTAADVVATFNGPMGEGNAGSAYGTFGVTPGAAAEVVDDYTVKFTLASPNGAFPFFTSSDNYNAGILPVSFWESYTPEAGTYEQSFVGTGPWVLESYDPGVGAAYSKNSNYWADNSSQPERMEVSFFEDEAAMVTAFQDGRLDVLMRVSPSLVDPDSATLLSTPTANHRQIYLDTRPGNPFGDKKVRQALALSINRDTFIQGLRNGFAQKGNDHPIWQYFPMFNADAVPQREEDLAEAMRLMGEAGFENGFAAPLDTLGQDEIPQLAQLVQSSAAQIGIDFTLNVTDAGTYYQDFWCAWPYEGPCEPGAQAGAGIVNYGHRGVPNVYLSSPLRSGLDNPLNAQWNSSHWQNTDYDALYDQWAAAPDLDTQIDLSGEMEKILWEEVPMIIPYFIDFVSATAQNFTGLEVTGMGHFDVSKGQFSS